MPDLENPLENCLWAWCIMNSDACISLIVHPPFGIPGSAPAVVGIINGHGHRYRASVTGLETPVIDVLFMLQYNYSNVASIPHQLFYQ